MEWCNYIVLILSGVATAIPLIYQLIKYVKDSIKSKNWINLVNLVLHYMEVAEKQFKTGSEKKQYVLSMIKASADTINYDIDMDAISDLIDSLCNMSKVVNAPTQSKSA